MKLLIQNGQVWNGEGFVQTDITVQDEAIACLGSTVSGDFDQVIDAAGKYVLPGIIDSHVHLSLNGTATALTDITKETETSAILTDIRSAEALVRAGVTTVRDCGGVGLETIVMKKAVQAKRYIGPRILACGQAIKTINGHFMGTEICGENEARRVARELIRDGADFIKIMATGGLGKEGEKPNVTELNIDEMAAAAVEGKKHDMPVVVHCHSKEGILNALAAGATSIEHATYLDEETVERMLEKDVFFTPTFSPYALIGKYGPQSTMPKYTYEAAQRIAEYKNTYFHLAYDRGVKLTYGRDSGSPFVHHGDVVFEMKSMSACGVSNRDIIKSATENSAKANHIWDKTGSITVGKSADLIVLEGNPLENIEAYGNLFAVIAQGSRIV